MLLKSNTSDVYTKTQVDTSLNSKANAADVYTKGQVDTSLGTKANTSDVNTALALKSNITDVNTSLALKVNIVDISNVANTKPSDLPVSTATITMIAGVNGVLSASIGSLDQTKANISNPTFPLNVNLFGVALMLPVHLILQSCSNTRLKPIWYI